MLLVEFLLAYGRCKDIYRAYLVYFLSEKRQLKGDVDEMLLAKAFPLRKPFEELCKSLGDKPVPGLPEEQPPKKRKPNAKSQAFEHPFVILTFDEVHTLAKPEDSGSWSRLGEMRRAIRGLSTSSLFTLFLSTSSALFGITPVPGRDASARMFLQGEVMLPFCELGFDKFVKYLDFRDTVKLSQVTSEEHLISYGRPLCVLNAQCIRLQLTFSPDSLLYTCRDNGTHYSALQPRSCWVVLHIHVNLS